MTPEDLERALREFLCESFRLDPADVTLDAELVSTGLVDSADIVRLVAFLERTLGISVPDADINAESFDSIAKILAYVERHEPS